MKGFLSGLIVGALCLWGLERAFAPTTDYTQALERNEQAWQTRARHTRDTLIAEVDTFTRLKTRWDTLRIHVTDSLIDTLYVQRLVEAGDSAIRSCGTALNTCQHLAELERMRADTAMKLANLYKTMARGRFLRLGAEVTTGDGGWMPAGDVQAGHRWSAVARLELPVNHPPVLRYGVRYEF